MNEIRYDGAYMFKYSPREGTPAFRLGDDIPEETKTRRLNEIILLQQNISYEVNQSLVGKTVKVMVGGQVKNPTCITGRTDTNKTVIFSIGSFNPGDTVNVRIDRASAATLFGEAVGSFS